MVLVTCVVVGALRSILHLELARVAAMLAQTVLFALCAVALAWPVALVARSVLRPSLRAVPPVFVGALVGWIASSWELPSGGLVSFVLGVFATALVLVPRLAAELAVVSGPARRDVLRAALALGVTRREADRLAAASDRVELDALLRGLVTAATDGIAALAAWRMASTHPLPLAGTALYTAHDSGAALPLVVLLALPMLLHARGVRTKVSSSRAVERTSHVEATQ